MKRKRKGYGVYAVGEACGETYEFCLRAFGHNLSYSRAQWVARTMTKNAREIFNTQHRDTVFKAYKLYKGKRKEK